MKPSIITDQIDQDLETALEIAALHRYEYVELHNVFGKSIERCTTKEVHKIQSLLQNYNMKVSNIASTIFFLCPLYEDYEVSLFNEEFKVVEGNIDEHLVHLKHACKIAKKLGCKSIRVFPFRFPDNKKPPFGTQEHITQIIMQLSKAAKIAEKEGVTIMLENCPYSHLPKGMMTIQVVKAVNSPNLKLLWDPANSYRAFKENVPEEYLQLSLLDELSYIFPYIGHVHLKNYCYDETLDKPFVHTALTSGDINFNKILTFLKENHYEQVLSLEPETTLIDTLKSMSALLMLLD